jgi:hypothetical protein
MDQNQTNNQNVNSSDTAQPAVSGSPAPVQQDVAAVSQDSSTSNPETTASGEMTNKVDQPTPPIQPASAPSSQQVVDAGGQSPTAPTDKGTQMPNAPTDTIANTQTDATTQSDSSDVKDVANSGTQMPNVQTEVSANPPTQTEPESAPEPLEETVEPASDNEQSEEKSLTGGELKAASADDSTEKKGEKGAKSADDISIELINADGGINLVPRMSQQEVQVEARKSKFNFLAAFFILFMVLISVVILGFNIFTKIQLEGEQAALKEVEDTVLAESDTIRANDQLLERISLYQNVQASTLSPKEVLVYWRELAGDYGEIQRVDMQNGLKFSFSGTSEKLSDVALLWHKLSIDERVSNINLNSVGQAESSVRYEFEGNLNFDYFASE